MKITLLIAAIAVGGCARMQDGWDCAQQAGPVPHPYAQLFGLAGAAAMNDDAQHAWDDRVTRCEREREAAR